jgi:hypothetical protein
MITPLGSGGHTITERQPNRCSSQSASLRSGERLGAVGVIAQ